MNRSAKLDKFAAAFAAAQSAIVGAVRNAENETLQTTYADLSSVWDACREALTTNGLSVLQFPRLIGEVSLSVVVETMILHTSGQFVSEALRMPGFVADPQQAGEGISYARRYALAAIVGVAPKDGDAQTLIRTPEVVNGEPVRVASAKEVRAKGGLKRWQVVLSNGNAYTVKNYLVGDHAVDLARRQVLVIPTINETRWKSELVGFTELTEHEEPLDVQPEDIPH